MTTATKSTKRVKGENGNGRREYPMTWSRPVYDWLAERTLRLPDQPPCKTPEQRVQYAAMLMGALFNAMHERGVPGGDLAIAAFGKEGEQLGIVDVPALDPTTSTWEPSDVTASVWPLRPHVAIVLLRTSGELTPSERTQEFIRDIWRCARRAEITIEDVVMVGWGGDRLSLATVGILNRLT